MKRLCACLLLLVSTGCAPYANGELAMLIPDMGKKPDTQEYYPQAAQAIAMDLDAQLAARLGFGSSSSRGLQWVVITTPTDINAMGQATPLSRMMAEQLGLAMTAQGYYVQEIRKTSEVVFNKAQGEFMLSRDVRELATKKFQGTLIVSGTYVATPYGVRFNIEVMDARNNDVLAKSSQVLPMSATVAYLQQAPAQPGASNIRPSVVTTPGTSVDPNATYMPQGDWRTSRMKTPNFLLP